MAKFVDRNDRFIIPLTKIQNTNYKLNTKYRITWVPFLFFSMIPILRVYFDFPCFTLIILSVLSLKNMLLLLQKAYYNDGTNIAQCGKELKWLKN